MKWKAFDTESWRVLLASLARLRRTADTNTSAVSGLGQNLAELSRLTALEVAGKQDKRSAVSITIPASGWNKDSTADYPQYYDFAVVGVTDKDRADIVIAPTGMRAASDCGLCPACETLAGIIRIRAETVPASGISAVYWLEKGKE